jgi:DNA polymerase-1
LIRSGGLEAVFDLESRVIWVTTKIEAAGIGIDVDALLTLHDDLTVKIDALAAELEKLIPPDIPLFDRSKIQDHLNSTYDLSLAKIDEDSVQWIRNAEVKDLASNLIEYWKTARECRNVELYISLTDDDRVCDSIDQLNTKTGRFYRPLQTVPKYGAMRSLFQAKEGYKFIVADYSQQEARIIAGLSNDQVAIDLFKSGRDIYLETANLIRNSEREDRWHRNFGKEIFLGLINGRSAYSIFEILEKIGFSSDLDDVQGMIFRYNGEFKEIATWQENYTSDAMKNGLAKTAMGRALRVSKDSNVNSLLNYPVQGTAADGFKLALIRLDDELAGQDARIVHILHDEVIVEARKDIADIVAATVKSCLEQAFKEILPNVPMIVKPVIKNSWG